MEVGHWFPYPPTTPFINVDSCTVQADNGELKHLARFIARQQLQAYLIAKSAGPEQKSTIPVSVFRTRRIEEAHEFISSSMAEVAARFDGKEVNAASPPHIPVVSSAMSCWLTHFS